MMKKQSCTFARFIACLLIAVCAGGGSISPAWAQSLAGTELERLEVTLGYQPSIAVQILSKCSAIGGTSISSPQSIEIPENAQAGDFLGGWTALTLPGWSCTRTMGVGGPGSGSAPPYSPECDNLSVQCDADGYMTKLRHWLKGNIPNAEVIGAVDSDGQSYHLIRRTDWIPPHPMAGIGFIVKWEADIVGTHTERGVTVDYPTNLNPAFGHDYAPAVPVIHPSQGPFNHNDYLVTDARVSYRMVLLAAGDTIKKSDGNPLTVTQSFMLGGDFCKWGVFQPCELNYSSASNAFFNYQALISVRHRLPTCTTNNVLVQFPNLSITQFSQPDAVAGLTPFMIELKNCASPLRDNLVYQLSAAGSGPPSPAPGNGLIPLNPAESTASGVDVQILDDQQVAHPLGTFRTAYTWGGPGSPPVTSVQIPLYAQVRRSGSTPVKGGHFKAAATFVMKYP